MKERGDYRQSKGKREAARIARKKCGQLVGKIVAGLYPANNYHGAKIRLEHRRVLVDRVRNLDDEPLDPETLAIEPLLHRGRILITGRDLDKNGAERSFYVERFVGMIHYKTGRLPR